MCCWGLRGSPRASRASQGPWPSAATVSVGRGAANAPRWRLQSCSRLAQFAMSRVLKASLNFDAVARQPGTVGAAVGAADGDAPGGGGGGALRGGAVSGARRAADVDATRGRRRRRRAQIVSSDAVQGEERERGNELGGCHLWRRGLVSLRLRGTRIVLRRACLCAVRWGNGLRCGTRAVVGRCFARICWTSFESVLLCPFAS